jgi:hypothetical protein
LAGSAVKSWSLWHIPRPAVVLVLAVDTSAIFAPASANWEMSSSLLVAALLLASLSITYSALTCSWERARRAVWENARTDHYRNFLAVWGFTAAVILPLPLAAAVIFLGAIAEWPARNMSGQAVQYRYVYSTAAAMLAAVSAHFIAELHLDYYAPLLLAALGYMAVGVASVMCAQWAVGHRAGWRQFLHWDAHRIEFITVSIGLATVLLLHSQLQPLAWLSLPVALVLQRYTVRRDLHALEDPQLAPMREQAWLTVAQEVMRACPVGSIMRIETSDPAAVGHLARIKAGCDAIGAAGESGLAILLTDCPATNAEALAERMRTVLRRESIDAQVAVAAKPRDGLTLADLLAVSEAELITRGAAGRPSRQHNPEA